LALRVIFVRVRRLQRVILTPTLASAATKQFSSSGYYAIETASRGEENKIVSYDAD